MRFRNIDEITQARIKRAVRLGKFELASQTRLQSFTPELVAKFMKRIFRLEEYLITDESRVSDFATTARPLARIKREYGLVVERSDYIVDILQRLA